MVYTCVAILKNQKIRFISDFSLLKIFLSTTSGLLLFFSFTHLPYLSLIALIPLLLAIENSSASYRFSYGMICGLSLYIPLLSFILNMEVSVRFYLYLGVLLLWLYLSFYYGVWALLTGRAMKKGGIIQWVLPAILFVSLEFIRSLTNEIGFPWGTLGYILVPNRNLMQIADITGVGGLSCLIIFSNFLLYRAFRKPLAIVPLILIFAFVVTYSRLRIDFLKTREEKLDVTVSVIQPNIPPEVKRIGSMDFRAERIERLSFLGMDADIIIWPESALPGYMRGKTEKTTRKIVDTLGVPVLMGCSRLFEGRVYNTAFLIEPKRGMVDYYDKIYLVPFGERLPFDEFLPFLGKLQFGQGDFSVGKRRTLFEVGSAKFGALICFESIFPQYVRRFVKEGADFMVNITDDSWYGISQGPYEHARMAVLRAVETRRPFVRCGNTGLSYVVTPLGEVRNKTELFQEAVITDDLYKVSLNTFYTEYGDTFSYFMIVFTILGLFCIFRPSRKDFG